MYILENTDIVTKIYFGVFADLHVLTPPQTGKYNFSDTVCGMDVWLFGT
jgi:hypothetical protein